MSKLLRKITLIFAMLMFSIGLIAQANAKQLALKYLKDNNRVIDKDTLMEIAYHEETYQLDLAIALLDIVLAICDRENDYDNLAKASRIKGLLFEYHQREDSAEAHQYKALHYAAQIEEDKLRDRRWILSALDLAILNDQKRDYEKAFDWYQKTLEKAKSTDNNQFELYCYYGIGEIYENVYEYSEAINWYYKALQSSKKEENNKGVVSALHTIGKIHMRTGYDTLAKENFNEALQIIKANPGDETDQLLGEHYYDVGELKFENQVWDEAMEYFLKSIDQFKKVNDQYQMTLAYMKVSQTSLKKNMTELAFDYITEAMNGKQYLLEEELAELLNTVGQIYYVQKNPNEAIRFYNQSLDVSKPNAIYLAEKESYFGLYKSAQFKGDFKQALKHYEEYSQVDSLLSADLKSKNIAEMRFKYKMEEKVEEIKVLQERQRRYMYLGIVGILLTMLGVMFYLYRTRVKNNNLLRNKNEEIGEQFRRLKESHNALEQFAFVAAHDLKEPLRTIGGYSSLMRRRKDKMTDEESNEYLSFMSEAAKRLSNLLDDLLVYSVVSKELPEHRPVELVDVIKQSITNIENEINEADAIIEYKNTEFPKVKIKEGHFVQLFEELISNGVKFNTNRPVVKIEAEKINGNLKIKVTDNGIGMNEDYKEKVFNIFHRLNRQTDDDGTGVGLTLAKNIVEKYEGYIDFSSTENAGTTFELTFPEAIIDK